MWPTILKLQKRIQNEQKRKQDPKEVRSECDYLQADRAMFAFQITGDVQKCLRGVEVGSRQKGSINQIFSRSKEGRKRTKEAFERQRSSY